MIVQLPFQAQRFFAYVSKWSVLFFKLQQQADDVRACQDTFVFHATD